MRSKGDNEFGEVCDHIGRGEVSIEDHFLKISFNSIEIFCNFHHIPKFILTYEVKKLAGVTCCGRYVFLLLVLNN